MKKFMALFMAILLTASLTACSGEKDNTGNDKNNTATQAEKTTADSNSATGGTTAAGTSVQWPAAVKEVPEFTKGTYIETIPMGGNMYTISFSGVTDADLDWYRGKLASSGFISQENEDTEGYAKMTGNATYSVGFTKTGSKLQIIVAFGTY